MAPGAHRPPHPPKLLFSSFSFNFPFGGEVARRPPATHSFDLPHFALRYYPNCKPTGNTGQHQRRDGHAAKLDRAGVHRLGWYGNFGIILDHSCSFPKRSTPALYTTPPAPYKELCLLDADWVLQFHVMTNPRAHSGVEPVAQSIFHIACTLLQVPAKGHTQPYNPGGGGGGESSLCLHMR